MMLKEKSNSWARLKLALLVPVAACTLLAFARPDVSRKLEQLVKSEGTDFSAPDKTQLQELFDRTVDEFIVQAGGKASITLKEKHALLIQKTNMVPLFINAKGQILFNNVFVENKDLPARLAALLAARSASDKPIAIYFLDDIDTPAGITDHAFIALKDAFEAYQATPNGTNNPMLVFCGTRKDFGTVSIRVQTHPATADIAVVVTDSNNLRHSFSVKPGVGTKQLEEQVKGLKADKILSAVISVPEGTVMGIITDVKSALIERYGIRFCQVRYN